MRGVFFDAICLLLAFLTGGHQNQTSWVPFLFTFRFVSLSFRYSVVLLLQLHSHMTGEYSCYKEMKIKNKNVPLSTYPRGKNPEHNINKKPNKSIFKNNSWSHRSWVKSLRICVHASSPWQLSCCVQFLFFSVGWELLLSSALTFLSPHRPLCLLLVASPATSDWFSVLIGSLCLGVLHDLGLTDHPIPSRF